MGYVPDPFGHVGQLPQILRGFGIECAAFRRGLGDDPVELWWEAPDGSRVLVSYLRDGYDNAARLPVRPDSFARVLRSLDEFGPLVGADDVVDVEIVPPALELLDGRLWGLSSESAKGAHGGAAVVPDRHD